MFSERSTRVLSVLGEADANYARNTLTNPTISTLPTPQSIHNVLLFCSFSGQRNWYGDYVGSIPSMGDKNVFLLQNVQTGSWLNSVPKEMDADGISHGVIRPESEGKTIPSV